MRTRVGFKSDGFPPYPGEEEDTNPGIWGKRLAEFIVSKLQDHGVKARDFYAEDWGWEIAIENLAFPIYIGCGNAAHRFGNEFICFIEPNQPEIRKWLLKKVVTTTDVERVANALDAVLRSHSQILDIQWG